MPTRMAAEETLLGLRIITWLLALEVIKKLSKMGSKATPCGTMMGLLVSCRVRTQIDNTRRVAVGVGHHSRLALWVDGHTGRPLLNSDGGGGLRARRDREHIDETGTTGGDHGIACAQIYGYAGGNGIGGEGGSHIIIENVHDRDTVAAGSGHDRQTRLWIHGDALGIVSDGKLGIGSEARANGKAGTRRQANHGDTPRTDGITSGLGDYGDVMGSVDGDALRRRIGTAAGNKVDSLDDLQLGDI